MSDWKNVQYKDGKMRTGEGGGGGGSSTLAGLDDVDLNNLQDGQIIKWDATNNKFVNANESGGSTHTYSTTEQVIGTWIDGKTMYEITIPFNTTASMNQSIDISGLNIDTPLFAELTAHCQLNGTDWSTGGYFQDTYDGLNCYVTSNKQTLVIRSKQNYPRGIGYCVLTYTKSSS
jgi:hypothetical protein